MQNFGSEGPPQRLRARRSQPNAGHAVTDPAASQVWGPGMPSRKGIWLVSRASSLYLLALPAPLGIRSEQPNKLQFSTRQGSTYRLSARSAQGQECLALMSEGCSARQQRNVTSVAWLVASESRRTDRSGLCGRELSVGSGVRSFRLNKPVTASVTRP